jgi:hypothetical protein
MSVAAWKSRMRRHPLAAALFLLVLGGLGWAALAPVQVR